MKLDSVAFYTNDIEKVIPFYRDIVGLQLEYQDGDKYVSFLFENDCKLGIKKRSESRETPGKQTVHVAVEQIENFYLQMKRKTRINQNLVSQPWGTEFSILDPDGNRIVFIERSFTTNGH